MTKGYFRTATQKYLKQSFTRTIIAFLALTVSLLPTKTLSKSKDEPKLLKLSLTTQRESTHKEDMISALRAYHKRGKRKGIFAKKSEEFYALALRQSHNNIAYFTTLRLGAGKGVEQEFMVDTGSSWLWIFKKNCFGEINDACKNAKQKKVVSYYDGSIEGRIGHIDVNLLGHVSKGHSIVIAEHTDSLMKNQILGLSMRNPPNNPNFLEVLKRNKIIKEKSFSFYRNPENVSQCEEKSKNESNKIFNKK